MDEAKFFYNLPSPYDLSGMKQASQRPDLVRQVTASYYYPVASESPRSRARNRKKKTK